MDGSRHTLLVSGVVRWPLLDSGRAGRGSVSLQSKFVRWTAAAGLRTVATRGIVRQQTRMLRSSESMVFQKMIEVEDAPPLLEL
jgi:hypothetical protein